jgi:hypothetical protein
MAALMTLPDELLLSVASYLPTSEIHKLTLTNRHLNALLEHRLYKNPTPRDIARMLRYNNLDAFRRVIAEGLDLTIEVGVTVRDQKPLLVYAAWKLDKPEFARMVLQNIEVSQYRYFPRIIMRRPDHPAYTVMMLVRNAGIPVVDRDEVDRGQLRFVGPVPGGLLFLRPLD